MVSKSKVVKLAKVEQLEEGVRLEKLAETARLERRAKAVPLESKAPKAPSAAEAPPSGTSTAASEASGFQAPKRAERGGPTLVNESGMIKLDLPPGKFDYIFGHVNSSAHSQARSEQIATQMKRLGIDESPTGKAILTHHFAEVLKQQDNIVNIFKTEFGIFETRESLLIGPSGKAVKFETTYMIMPDNSRKFTTVITKD